MEPEVHYRIYKSLSPVPIPSQIIPVTGVSILIGKLYFSPQTCTVLSGDACLDFVQSMVANREATLSNACHRNAGTTKTFSLTTFRYRSLLAEKKYYPSLLAQESMSSFSGNILVFESSSSLQFGS